MQAHTIDHILCPAKLNLFLHVTGKRPDGYHLLQSIFAPIDWYDILHFERRTDGKISRHDLLTPLPQNDLITRAATLLQKTSGTSLGADISIEKHIPMQAGLGGGSANAATVLILLNHLWQLNLTQHQLLGLAVQLGSDVPFFLYNTPCWVEGIGEIITPIQLPPDTFNTAIALLKPNNGVSTQQIFSSNLLTNNTKPATISHFTSSIKNKFSVFDFGRNDLQKAATAIEPEIKQALHQLKSICSGQTRMTGSGSTVFGAVRQNINTPDLSTNFLPLGWQLKMCKILDFSPLSKWLPSSDSVKGTEK